MMYSNFSSSFQSSSCSKIFQEEATKAGVVRAKRQQARRLAQNQRRANRERSKERSILMTALRDGKRANSPLVLNKKARRTLGIAPIMSMVNLAWQLFRLFGHVYDFGLDEDELIACSSVFALRSTFHLSDFEDFHMKVEAVYSVMDSRVRPYFLKLCFLKMDGRPFRFVSEDGNGVYALAEYVKPFGLAPDFRSISTVQQFDIVRRDVLDSQTYTVYLYEFLDFIGCDISTENIDVFHIKLKKVTDKAVRNTAYGYFLLCVLSSLRTIAWKNPGLLRGDQTLIFALHGVVRTVGEFNVDSLFGIHSQFVKGFRKQSPVVKNDMEILLNMFLDDCGKRSKLDKIKDFASDRLKDIQDIAHKIMGMLKLSEEYLRIIEPVINVGEVLLVICNVLMSPQTNLSIYTQIYLLARLHLPTLSSVIIAGLATALCTAFLKVKPQFATQALEDYANSAANNVEYIVESSLVQSIAKFIVALCSYKLFSKETAQTLYAYFGKAYESMTIPGVISLSLRLVAQILRVSRLIWEGVPIVSALFEEDPVVATITETKELMIWKDNLFSGLPVPGKMSRVDFYRRAKAYLMILDKALKRLPKRSNVYKAASVCRLELIREINNIDTQIMGSQRITPVWINVAGPPGIGKSSILAFNAFIMSEVLNIEYKDTLTYPRVKSSDYWEGYDPISHPFVHYSELGATHANIVKSKGDDIITELTSVVDSLAYSVDMAYEGKGKVFCRPWLVLSDTNNEQLNLNYIVNTPAAYLRRMWVCRVRVRKEYATETGEPIPSRIQDLSKPLEAWLFTLVKYNNEGKEIIIVEDVSPHTYANTLRKMIYDHVCNQTYMIGARSPQKMAGYGDMSRILDVLPREQQKGAAIEGVPNEFSNSVKSDILTLFNKVAKDAKSLFSSYKDPMFGISALGCFKEPSATHPIPYAHSVFLPHVDEALLSDSISDRESEETDEEKSAYCTESGYEVKDPSDQYEYNNSNGLSDSKYINSTRGKQIKQFLRERAELLEYVSKCDNEDKQHFTSQILFSTAKRWSDFQSDGGVILFKNWIHGQIVKSKSATLCFFLLLWALNIIGFISLALFAFLIYFTYGDYTSTLKWNEVKRAVDFKFNRLTRRLFSNEEGDSILKWYDPKYSRVIVILLAVSATVTTGVAVASFFSGKRSSESIAVFKKSDNPNVQTEAHTEFQKDDTQHTQVINDVEKVIEAGSRLRRIANSQLTVWNDVVVREAPVYTGEPITLSNNIAHNVRHVQVHFSREVNGAMVNFIARSMVTGVYGNVAIINTHFVKKYMPCVLKVFHSQNEDTSFVESRISEKCISYMGDDLALIQLSGVQFRNILKHFAPTRSFPSFGKGSIGTDMINISKYENIFINGSLTIKNAYIYDWQHHNYGKCGTPVVMKVNAGCIILGIHSAGAVDLSQAVGICESVSRDEVSAAAKMFEDGLMRINSQCEISLQLVDPIPKSPFLHVRLPDVAYYGRVNEPVLAFNSSKLIRTCWSKSEGGTFLDNLFFEYLGFMRTKTFIPPLMKAAWRDGKWISPYNNCLTSLNVIKPALNRETLLKTIDVLVNRFSRGLDEAGIRDLTPLTFEQAMNGVQDDPYIRRINASTAAGFRFPGKKKKYLVEVKKDEIYHPDRDVRKKVEDILISYKEQRCSDSYYKANLKDEPRNSVKVAKGETRVFFSSEFPHLLVNRMFLGPLYSLMVSHSQFFCTAIGIDMHRDYDSFFPKTT
jgi:hypothetical protein